jgi:hypothetical protein
MVGAAALWMSGGALLGQSKVVFERHPTESAAAGFTFKNVPSPAVNDAATQARFSLVDGRADPNAAPLAKLHDGQVATEEDQPSECFFFRAGTDGGRLRVDLGRAVEIQQVNTYSWHPNTRGPQVYVLYSSTGTGEGFNAEPKRGTDPLTCGWKLMAKVDTRPAAGDGGGQHGVSLSATNGALGPYRYLLFDIFPTEARDAFGNTFYTEIDVLDLHGPAPERVQTAALTPVRRTIQAGDGKYEITLDTTETPDLTAWVDKELVPVVQEWYPKLVALLPSEGFEAPRRLSIVFSKEMQGVAATSGARIRCAASWYRRNLKGEAIGSIVHEMVHVVQQYGRTRRLEPGATRAPGWLTEGLTDYIRWYLFEPQSRGAEITQRNLARARYDGSYRITANFLNWVTEKFDKDLVVKLNAAIREGRYSEDWWKKLTGHTLQDLGEQWKKALEEKLGVRPAAASLRFVAHRLGTFRSEACGVGDFNNDQRPDIVAGAFLYLAPDFKPVKIRTLKGSVDDQGKGYHWDFMNEPFDVDGDGWLDVVSCDWFQKHVSWFRNPGTNAGEWVETVLDQNGNYEHGGFWDLDGDGKANELVPAVAHTMWYEWAKRPDGRREFVKHTVSEKVMNWGVGVGDVNGDGRPDLLRPDAWFEAPADLRAGQWIEHPLKLGHKDAGKADHTAQILVHDVNGDGRHDILCSSAHGYGIFWYEQVREGETITFKQHLIDDTWTQAHSLTLADLDGDRLPELLTGKRFMAHNGSDPDENAPLGVYAYQLQRGPKPVWSRQTLSFNEGIGAGMEVRAVDLDGDGDLDVVVTGKWGGPVWFENVTLKLARQP